MKNAPPHVDEEGTLHHSAYYSNGSMMTCEKLSVKRTPSNYTTT